MNAFFTYIPFGELDIYTHDVFSASLTRTIGEEGYHEWSPSSSTVIGSFFLLKDFKSKRQVVLHEAYFYFD